MSDSPLHPAQGQARRNFSRGIKLSLPSSHLTANSSPICCRSIGRIQSLRSLCLLFHRLILERAKRPCEPGRLSSDSAARGSSEYAREVRTVNTLSRRSFLKRVGAVPLIAGTTALLRAEETMRRSETGLKRPPLERELGTDVVIIG